MVKAHISYESVQWRLAAVAVNCLTLLTKAIVPIHYICTLLACRGFWAKRRTEWSGWLPLRLLRLLEHRCLKVEFWTFSRVMLITLIYESINLKLPCITCAIFIILRMQFVNEVLQIFWRTKSLSWLTDVSYQPPWQPRVSVDTLSVHFLTLLKVNLLFLLPKKPNNANWSINLNIPTIQVQRKSIFGSIAQI